MKVKVYLAYLVVNEKEVRLTKSIARQFPLLDARARLRKAEAGEEAREPIGKVRIKALGHPETSGYKGVWAPRGWVYLVEDAEAGLAWVSPIVPMAKLAEAIMKAGGWVDHPEEVPTIIL